MKLRLIPLLVLFSVSFTFSQDNSFWTRTAPAGLSDVKSSKQSLPKNLTFSLNLQALNQQLNLAPVRGEFSGISNVVLPFPDSDGNFQNYRILKAPVLSAELSQQYPEIQSYVGQGIDDPSSVIRFSVSPLGLSSMVLSSSKAAVFIEPYTNDLQGYVVFKKSEKLEAAEYFECEVTEAMNKGMVSGSSTKNADDGILRDYRLAVSATGEYTQYHGGTKALALAAINTTMTRVNGIFEVDFNVTMTLIANTDDVIYTNPSTDPYGNTTSNYNSQLQSTLSSVIGESNYDIGHLFANLQNNGNAGCIGCVCVNNQKGSGWTSATIPEGDFFDVDYVAHEMGHQFGANHTWTHGGNEGTNAQMEPGSGSTIMSYAGITGATDVQSSVDPYFHGISIQQITNYIKGTSCQTNIPTGNSVPTVNAGLNYTIPRGTPFVLEGTATDADTGDVLTYCWEQFDENNAQTTYPNVNNTSGVAFRTYNPTTANERYFPRLETIKAGQTAWTWEAIPNVGRTLNFRLTVRDNVAGGGTNNSGNMVVTVNGTAGPFVVTSPDTAVNWSAGSTQTVSWNVAGTTGNGVNASTVDIFLSTDGGDTYPIALAAGVANDGSHDILIPNNQSTQCRIMVRGSGNIFFDISNTDFTISGQVPCNATVPTSLATTSIGADNATLGWDAVAGATYDLQYRVVGAPTWIDVFDIVGVSYQLTGLNPLTQYEAQVRSKCPDTSTSAYSSPISFTTTDVPLNYCASQSSNVNDEFIGRVQLNTIDNSSGAAFYSDFTSISTTLTKGSQYTITVTPTWTGQTFNEGYAVWIDYNRDGDFTDSGELVFSQSPTTASPVSGSFTVPASAVENSTRMRVSMKYNGIPSSCESFTYGEVEDYTIVLQAAGPDTEAPTAPTNLTASNTTDNSTDLNWNAATDNVGVTDYDVYQDGGFIANVTGTSYQVTGLLESTSYAFYVIANDAAGNSSPQSNTVNETTLAAPTCSDGIQNGDETGVDCGGTSCAPCATVTLNEGYFETGFDGWIDGGSDCDRVLSGNSWEGSYSIRLRDNSGVSSSMTSPSYDLTNYESVEISFYAYPNSMENGEDLWLQFNDGSGWTTIATYVSGSDFTNGNFFNDTVVVVDTQFNFGPSAQFRFRCDASGNNDQVYIDEVITIGTLAGPADTEAPSTPANLTASNTTSFTTDLNWDASTDNVGVTGYDVYQDGAFLTNVAVNSYQVTGLSPSTSYDFYVIARDAAGNSSSASNTVNVTTDPFVDTEAPTAPTGLAASNTTETTTDLSWNASTDNVGVTDYDVYQDGGLIANVSTTSYQVSGLTENTTYAFYVIANDAAGNSSAQSNTVNETTLAAPTCSDGIQNGDETGVDCGGSFCPPCSDVTLNQGFFETGWDGWIDGGSDCARVLTSNSWEGSYSIRLRDNSGVSSSMSLNNIDASPYSQVEVDFYFYVNSMENGEDFWLRFFDGSSWTTVATWTSGSGISNGNFYNATVPLTSAQYNFAVNSGFRFQCDASGNNDQIYIDAVTITGTNSAKGGEPSLILVGSLAGSDKDFENFKLYPIPVKGDILYAELSDTTTFDFEIKNLIGQTVLKGKSQGSINVASLKSGMYIIEVNDGDEVMTKRFIRQ